MDRSDINLDNVTIDECMELFLFKNVTTELNDGQITGFVKE